MLKQSCPTLGQIEAFARKTDDAQTQTFIAQHIQSCADCRSSLKDISDNLKLIEPLQEVMSADDDRDREHSRAATQPPPEQIGRYRIERELGRGGMGVVYLAEQDHPRRLVALKVIRRDVITSGLLRRFELEANILARLRHPGIASIHEAGMAESSAPDGTTRSQPYFAMEFVQGVRLDLYVEQQKFTWRQRLELMAGIADAVHHAHINGIVHRDLKPGNILVQPPGDDDSSSQTNVTARLGQPKILDFGVARLTDTDVQTMTLHTRVGQVIGTVPYMSPEQVTGSAADVDARSDVYALGVMTFELLSGQLPIAVEDCALPEVARRIRDETPTRLGQMQRHFRGDVETVIAKCLDKEPARRYQSAAEFAADVRRFLNDQPIEARPPSTMYQLRKFARRNRAATTAIGSLAALLVFVAALSIVLAVRATASNAIAQQQTDKYKAVNQFVQDMLSAADPDRTPDNPDITVRQAIDGALEELNAGALRDQPQVEAAVRTTIGNVLRSLGDFDAAGRELRRAVKIGRQAYDGDHEDLAFSIHKLARLLEESGQYEQSEQLCREALAMRQRLFGDTHEDVATSQNNLAYLLDLRGEYDQAEQLHRDTLAMRRRLFGEKHVDIANSLNNLAVLYHRQGRFDEAEPLYRESLQMDRSLRGELHPNVISTMSNLAVLLQSTGRLDEAEPMMREVLDKRRQVLGDEHHMVAVGMQNLARVLHQQEEFAEGETLYRESLEMDVRLRGPTHPAIARTKANFARLLQDMGRAHDTQAERLFRESLNAREEAFGTTHVDTLSSHFLLGGFYMQRNRFDEAEPHLHTAASRIGEALSPTHPLVGTMNAQYGRLLMRRDRNEEAIAYLQTAYEVLSLGNEQDRTDATEIAGLLAQLWDRTGEADTAALWRSRAGQPN